MCGAIVTYLGALSLAELEEGRKDTATKAKSGARLKELNFNSATHNSPLIVYTHIHILRTSDADR